MDGITTPVTLKQKQLLARTLSAIILLMFSGMTCSLVTLAIFENGVVFLSLVGLGLAIVALMLMLYSFGPRTEPVTEV